MITPAIKPQQGWNGICIDLQARIGLRAACRFIRTPRSVAIPDNHEPHSFLPNDSSCHAFARLNGHYESQ
jgi:hypothetical protein